MFVASKLSLGIFSFAVLGSIAAIVTSSIVLSTRISTLNGEIPKGQAIPFGLVSYTGNPTHFENAFNLLEAYIGTGGTIIRYKDFTEIEVTIGGAIVYENSTVDVYPNTGRNTSFIFKDVFPAEFPFPMDFFPNSLSLSKPVRFDIDLTSFVSFNIQPNGIDLEIVLFIPDGAPALDLLGEKTWVMDPFNYNYVINR